MFTIIFSRSFTSFVLDYNFLKHLRSRENAMNLVRLFLDCFCRFRDCNFVLLLAKNKKT